MGSFKIEDKVSIFKEFFDGIFSTLYLLKSFSQLVPNRISLLIFLAIGNAIFDAFGISMLVSIVMQTIKNGEYTNSLDIPLLGMLQVGGALQMISLFMTIFIIKAIVLYLYIYFLNSTKAGLCRAIRVSLAFNGKETGDAGPAVFTNKLIDQTNKSAMAFQDFILAISFFLQMLILLVLALHVYFSISIFLILYLSFIFILFSRVNIKISNISKSVVDSSKKLASRGIEYFSNMFYLRTSDSLPFFLGLIQNNVNKIYGDQKKIGVYLALTGSTRELFIVFFLLTAMIFFIGGPEGKVDEFIVAMALLYRSSGLALSLQTTTQAMLLNLSSFVDIENEIISGYGKSRNNCEPEISNWPDDADWKFIRGKNLSFQFDVDQSIISRLNFVVEPGEILAIIGPSGSGKSSLLELMVGAKRPSEGEVTVITDSGCSFPLRSYPRLGWVPQNPPVFDLSFYENIRLNQGGLCGNEIEQIKELCSRLCLEVPTQFLSPSDRYSPLVDGLSGGQRKKMALIREVCRGKDLILLDEPTAGLDSYSEECFISVMLEMRPNTTFVVVTHSDRVKAIADKVIVLGIEG